MRLISLLVLVILGLQPAFGAEAGGAWQDPQVLRAAFEIDMTPEQRPHFRESMTEFLQGYGADVRRILNGRDRTDLPRKIERKRRARLRSMDRQMGDFLTEAQWPAYERWRDLLLEKMAEQFRRR